MKDAKGKPAGAVGMFDFAIGDWRGTGKTGNTVSDICMTCLKSPGGKGVEVIQFDDDRAGGKVFYAEHLTIVPGRTPGVMKVTRRGFAFQDAGEDVFVLHEVARKTGDGVRISSEKGAKNFLQNDLVLAKEGADGLVSKGTASAGGGTWSFEFHLKRRTPRKRSS